MTYIYFGQAELMVASVQKRSKLSVVCFGISSRMSKVRDMSLFVTVAALGMSLAGRGHSSVLGARGSGWRDRRDRDGEMGDGVVSRGQEAEMNGVAVGSVLGPVWNSETQQVCIESHAFRSFQSTATTEHN